MRLIDADALMRRIQQEQIQAQVHGREFSTSFYNAGGTVSTEWWFVEDLVENAPTIEPKRKTGKWVHGREIGRDKIGDCIIAIIYDGWKCSSCGCLVEESREPLYKFCPQCGADMRGVENENR